MPDLSPLSGQPVHEKIAKDAKVMFREPPIGDFMITDQLLSWGFQLGKELRVPSLHLDVKDTKRLLALALTKAREAAVNGSKPPYFMSEEGYEHLRTTGQLQGQDFHAWRVWTVESLWQELQSLTLEEKAERTLVSLVQAEPEVGQGVHLGLRFLPDEAPPGTWDGRNRDLAGLAYGCTPSEAHVVIRFLKDEGLIETKLEAIYITPKGYVRASEVAGGKGEVLPRGFVVCKFNENLDAMYEGVYKSVLLPTGEPVTLLRVKDIHHVEKIDDKIMAEIRAASFVLVDLSDNNFNVGFEAGYALALGKPIVFTMQKPEGELKLPFDIQSHNILVYDAADHTEFKEQLPFRIAAALDKAREQSRWKS